MDWMEDVRARLKRKNQILFSPKDAFLQDLGALIGEQNHRTMVLWAFDWAEEAVKRLEEKYPHDSSARSALEASKLWAAGKVKMPVAKREILNCHAFAKQLTSPEYIALCHAVGQACGVVHATGHAMGFPVYDLTAMVHRFGLEDCKGLIELRKQAYMGKILYWKQPEPTYAGEWAGLA